MSSVTSYDTDASIVSEPGSPVRAERLLVCPGAPKRIHRKISVNTAMSARTLFSVAEQSENEAPVTPNRAPKAVTCPAAPKKGRRA